MSCGCGGECCKQSKGLGYVDAAPMAVHYPSHIRRVVRGPKGLGFLWWGGSESADEDIYGDYDYLFDYGGNYGGDWGGWDASIFDLGLPNWQDTREFGGYYVDPNTGAFLFTDNTRLPSQTGAGTYGTSNDNWQGLLDWWNDLVGGVIGGGDAGGGTNPQLPGYCPGGYYHPQNDPFACVPFPPETNAQQRQKAIAAGNAANAAAKAAQAKAQQQAQGCPPNTGLVKNAQGQCVCPPGYAANAQLKKCVLVNASLAAQANQAPDWLKYALLALGAVVVVKAVKK